MSFKYRPELDGLRALAVSAVIIYHFYQAALPGGWVGVDVFFVLSGYLITRILSDEISTHGNINIKNFYVRRFLRLYPALVLVLCFEIARLLFFHGDNSRLKILQAVAASALYVMNWVRAFGFDQQGYIGHTWSLAMEEQFYLLWPFLLAFTLRRRPIAWVSLICVCIVAWRIYLVSSGVDYERTYNGFDTHSDSLFIGCLTALLSSNGRIVAFAGKLLYPAIIGLCSIALFAPTKSLFTHSIGFTLAAVLTGLLILGLSHSDRVSKFLSLKPLVYTGRISYGLYLWHFPLMLTAMQIWGKSWLVWTMVPVTYVIAATSFRYFETPILALKSKFTR